ncbi:MAG TPA: hypothetical protein VFI16_08135 [Anaeromyxobacteraceae bacterium]|nr:hypothetical protein [Anaeromyxobacteraceae bacterium]
MLAPRLLRAARLLALPAALLAPLAARACSVCACGDPLAAVAETPGNRGSLRFALEAETLRVTSASEAMAGMTDELTQWTLRPSAVWSPLPTLNLVATVPFTNKRMDETGMGMDSTMSDLSGLGDVELGVRWFPFQSVDFAARLRHSGAVMAGTSFPTGSNDAASNGVRVDEHGQLGTGGFGPYLGLFYRLSGDTWSGFATLTGRVRTENSHGYRYGQSLHWALQGQWQPGSWFAASLALEGRSAAADREQGAAAPNTGGLVLAATPAVHFNVFAGAWLFARAQLPVHAALLGEQTVAPVFTTGIRYEAL